MLETILADATRTLTMRTLLVSTSLPSGLPLERVFLPTNLVPLFLFVLRACFVGPLDRPELPAAFRFLYAIAY